MDHKTWIGQADCLNSQSCHGLVTNLESLKNLTGEEEFIVVENQMNPTDVLHLDRSSVKVKAVVLREGSLADHTAGLLNGRGIQLAVIPSLPNVKQHMPIYVSGVSEQVMIGSFNDEQIKSLEIEPTFKSSFNPNGEHHLPRVLIDGKNAGELYAGIEAGGDGIGILRTEWLGWDNQTYPSKAMHTELYKECVEAVAPHRTQVRLFDIGGDKIPGWASEAQLYLNSPLGYRGIRAAHVLQEAFKTQLAALADLEVEPNIGIVIPMVTDVQDIILVKQILSEVSPDWSSRIKIGMMVEVPSAALTIRNILPEVDFVRIGPGDLTQFTIGKLRQNFKRSDLSGSMIHESVLPLIKYVVEECKSADTPVSICLDIEPRIPLLEKLLETGIRAFCVSPPNVEITKKRLASLYNLPDNTIREQTKNYLQHD